VNTVLRGILVGFLLIVLTAETVAVTTSTGAEADKVLRPTGPESGEDWIQNQYARLKVIIYSQTAWKLHYYRWDETEQDWTYFFHTVVTGRNPERQNVVGGPPAQVKTWLENGLPRLSLRQSKGEQFLEVVATILKDTPFVLVEKAASSPDDLVPYFQVQFHQPMTHLVTDNPGNPVKPTVMAAHDYHTQHKFPAFAKYCLAYRADESDIYAILWPNAQRQTRKVQFPPGPFQTAFFEGTFVMYGEDFSEQRDSHTLAHYGEGLYWLLRDLLGGQQQ